MITDFKPGDLVSTLDFKGSKIYALVLCCHNRYGFMEIQALSGGKVKAIVYDGATNAIVIEQRGN